MIPNHLSHYYVHGAEPFQTISELDDNAWQKLCVELAERRLTDPSYNRRFGPRYRSVRLEAEEKLRACFRAKGGLIQRKAPIYFCLGSSDWWLGFCDHREVRINLFDRLFARIPKRCSNFSQRLWAEPTRLKHVWRRIKPGCWLVFEDVRNQGNARSS